MKYSSQKFVMNPSGLLLLSSLLICALLGLSFHTVLHHHGEDQEHEADCPLCILLSTLLVFICAYLCIPPSNAVRRIFLNVVALGDLAALRAHPLRGPPFAHQF